MPDHTQVGLRGFAHISGGSQLACNTCKALAGVVFVTSCHLHVTAGGNEVRAAGAVYLSLQIHLRFVKCCQSSERGSDVVEGSAAHPIYDKSLSLEFRYLGRRISVQKGQEIWMSGLLEMIFFYTGHAEFGTFAADS